MAQAVQLKHARSGVTRTGYFGFSWTSFFFGGIPALMRGDIAYGLAVLVVAIALAVFSFGILGWAVGIIWAFVYNKNYTQRLLQDGYEFNDSPATVAAARKALGVS